MNGSKKLNINVVIVVVQTLKKMVLILVVVSNITVGIVKPIKVLNPKNRYIGITEEKKEEIIKASKKNIFF